MRVPAGEGFPKAARIRRRGEFLAMGRVGERRHTEHFVLIARPAQRTYQTQPTRSASGATRLGITVSRKVGGAVVRNRVKRRVRSVFRRDPERLLPDSDLIVIAKPGAGAISSRDIERELRTGARTLRQQRSRRGA